MTFQSCLQRGLKYETEALKYFDVAEFNQSIGCVKEYDLEITHSDGKVTLVEVKADFLCQKTGNVALEWQCNGQPSGLTATFADVWVIFVVRGTQHDCYIVPIHELTPIANRCRSVYGGDGGRAQMHLVPVDMLAKYKKNPLPPKTKPWSSTRCPSTV